MTWPGLGADSRGNEAKCVRAVGPVWPRVKAEAIFVEFAVLAGRWTSSRPVVVGSRRQFTWCRPRKGRVGGADDGKRRDREQAQTGASAESRLGRRSRSAVTTMFSPPEGGYRPTKFTCFPLAIRAAWDRAPAGQCLFGSRNGKNKKTRSCVAAGGKHRPWLTHSIGGVGPADQWPRQIRARKGPLRQVMLNGPRQ